MGCVYDEQALRDPEVPKPVSSEKAASPLLQVDRGIHQLCLAPAIMSMCALSMVIGLQEVMLPIPLTKRR